MWNQDKINIAKYYIKNRSSDCNVVVTRSASRRAPSSSELSTPDSYKQPELDHNRMVVIEQDTIKKMTVPVTKAEVEDLLKDYNFKTKPRTTEPGSFYGRTSENAREWLNNFESYCALNNLKDEEKILTFSLLLKSAAKSFYNNICSEDKKSWAKVKDKFHAVYFDSNNYLNSQKIEDRKLVPGESCEQYISDMTELSLLCGMDEAEFRKCLIRGLPEQLRWYVVGFDPRTVEETIKRIHLGAATMRWSETGSAAVNSLDTKDWKLVDMMEKITDRLEKLELSSRLEAGKKKEEDGGRYTPMSRNMFCNICRRTNHTTSQCYSGANNATPRARPYNVGYPRGGRTNYRGRPGNNNGGGYYGRPYNGRFYNYGQNQERYPKNAMQHQA